MSPTYAGKEMENMSKAPVTLSRFSYYDLLRFKTPRFATIRANNLPLCNVLRFATNVVRIHYDLVRIDHVSVRFSTVYHIIATILSHVRLVMIHHDLLRTTTILIRFCYVSATICYASLRSITIYYV